MPVSEIQRSDSLNPFRTLARHRNFRIFWIGQTASLVGTWMQTVAQGWLALELTNDAFMVGLVGAAGSLPVLFLSLYGGVLADRHDKLRLVLVAQSLLLVEAALLWWFVWTGQITTGWLVTLVLFGGVVNAFDIPARQSFIIELVGKEDLFDAIALNSGGFNLARIIGPAVGAAIIAKAGLAWCFAANALSYLAVLAGLLMIDRPPRASAVRDSSSAAELWRSIVYMWKTREVSVLIRMVAVYSVLGAPFLVLMPVIARDVLHTDASGYGFLLTCVGVGAIAAALALAAAGRRVRRGRLLAVSAYTLSVLLIVFALSRSLWFSALTLVAVGFAMIVQNALANALLQTIVPDSFRGRVMAAYAFVFIGFAPIGQLLAGAIARGWSAAWAIGGGAALMLGYAVWAFRREPEVIGLP